MQATYCTVGAALALVCFAALVAERGVPVPGTLEVGICGREFLTTSSCVRVTTRFWYSTRVNLKANRVCWYRSSAAPDAL